MVKTKMSIMTVAMVAAFEEVKATVLVGANDATEGFGLLQNLPRTNMMVQEEQEASVALDANLQEVDALSEVLAIVKPQPSYKARSKPCNAAGKRIPLGTHDGNTFRCRGTYCLPVQGLCNGVKNCHDGSDERGCTKAYRKHTDKAYCRNRGGIGGNSKYSFNVGKNNLAACAAYVSKVEGCGRWFDYGSKDGWCDCVKETSGDCTIQAYDARAQYAVYKLRKSKFKKAFKTFQSFCGAQPAKGAKSYTHKPSGFGGYCRTTSRKLTKEQCWNPARNHKMLRFPKTVAIQFRDGGCDYYRLDGAAPKDCPAGYHAGRGTDVKGYYMREKTHYNVHCKIYKKYLRQP